MVPNFSFFTAIPFFLLTENRGYTIRRTRNNGLPDNIVYELISKFADYFTITPKIPQITVAITM